MTFEYIYSIRFAMSLACWYDDQPQEVQAGVDEAGRGCLLGPVFAAAVVWDPSADATGIKDSKKLSPNRRKELRKHIEANAIAYGVGSASHEEIDEHNMRED